MATPDRIAKTLSLLAIVFLAGCSSTPSRFYALDSGAASGGAPPPDISVMIGPFDLPGYLDRPQIVTRTGGARLKFGEFDLWAEPLDEGINRTVWKNVQTLLDSDVIFDFPLKNSYKLDYQVAGRIRRFEAGQSGVAVFELQWVIFDKRENRMVGSARLSSYEEPTGSGSYEDIVMALNRTLMAFSRDVADALRSLPQHAPAKLSD